MDEAYAGFFKHQRGYPKFKSKKKSRLSYMSTNNAKTIEIKDGRIKLPKLGWVKVRGLPSSFHHKILSATVSRTKTGKYFVSVNCESVKVKEFPKTSQSAGLDLGLHSFITFDDGNKIPSFCFSKKSQDRISRYQAQLSRKQRGSRNYEKLRKKLAIEFEKVYNRRYDAYHKLSSDLVRKYDFIAVETLDIQGMLSESTHKIAYSISDAAWYELASMIEYKAKWYDKQYVKVDTYYPSSQTCNCCGYINPALKDLKIRKWTCPQCGQVHNRDVNAAKNILDEARRLISAA